MKQRGIPAPNARGVRTRRKVGRPSDGKVAVVMGDPVPPARCGNGRRRPAPAGSAGRAVRRSFAEVVGARVGRGRAELTTPRARTAGRSACGHGPGSGEGGQRGDLRMCGTSFLPWIGSTGRTR